MLLITYCKVSPRQIRPERMHLILALIQIFGCFALYLVFFKADVSIAEGALICILTPTATSAPVITGLLGGNVASLATYSIASNLSIAFLAPLFFSIIGAHGQGGTEELTFIQSLLTICSKVVPLALGPFILSIILKKFLPAIHNFLRTRQMISFWMWNVALVLLMARTTTNICDMDSNLYGGVAGVAGISLFCCLLQFLLGRRIGRNYDNTVAGGQALGQKNTILAIWMAQTFFSPIVAIAPASYVLWQNLVNSFQMYRHGKKSSLRSNFTSSDEEKKYINKK